MQRRLGLAGAADRHDRRPVAAADGRRSGRGFLLLPPGSARHDSAQSGRYRHNFLYVGADGRQLRTGVYGGQSRARRPHDGIGNGGRPFRDPCQLRGSGGDRHADERRADAPGPGRAGGPDPSLPHRRPRGSGAGGFVFVQPRFFLYHRSGIGCGRRAGGLKIAKKGGGEKPVFSAGSEGKFTETENATQSAQ